jgi:tetratricopeptide (TPR) repeat protein
MIDNAGNVEQVRPLLPGSPSCVAVVTSRDALAGLVARGGARRLALGLLPPAEATGLLRAVIGERLDAEPEAAVTLAGYCARLPLALRVAAERAAAALTDTTLRQARWLLDRLARAHLIQPAGTGRYDLHDLLRAYAAEQAAHHDSEQQRRAALTRLFDHYLATAAVAAGVLFPADPDQPALPPPVGPVPPVTSPAAALAWLDAQRSTLVAVAAHAAGHGWPSHAIGLGATIFRYLDVGYFTDAAALHSLACHAAARVGDRAAEAAALTMLGAADAAQGRLRQATGHLEQALALCRGDGNRIGEARVLGHLGMVGYCQGRYQRSARYHRKALAIYLEIGDQAGEARELHGLGVVDLRQGRYAQAASLLRRSLELGREIGSMLCQARALAWLGLSELRRGLRRQGVGHLRQSLALHGQAGNCSGQAEALNGLGEAFLAARQAAQASARHAAALALAIQCGDQPEQARARSGLASACRATGDRGQARSHRRAVASYADLGTPGAEQVRAQIAPGV